MGLDIYLYPQADAKANDAHEAATDAFYNREGIDQLSDEDRREQLRAAEIPPYVRQADVPSEKYPDHLFNRRYLRSSYNGSGFNRAVPDMIAGLTDDAVAELVTEGNDVGSLYWIFEPMGREWDGDEGWLNKVDIPGLEACMDRALQVAKMLTECDPLRVEAIHMPMFGAQDHMWSGPPSEAEVLSWYRAEKAKRDAMAAKRLAEGKPDDGFWSEDGGYSSAKGTVFGFKTGMEVLAITLGKDVLGGPAPMIVYRSGAVDSYIQSAEIVAEFCAEAIELIKRDGGAYISWSG